MSKEPVATAIRKTTGCTVAQSNAAAAAAFDALKAALKETRILQISGFGTFRIVARGERAGTNPKTGAKIRIPAGQTIRFKPSDAMLGSLGSPGQGRASVSERSAARRRASA